VNFAQSINRNLKIPVYDPDINPFPLNDRRSVVGISAPLEIADVEKGILISPN